ncbi:hypothetical protein SARC_07091 [Sphaeroforma arctica JP610]|uniref:Lanosterol 14-alpha demethylase n=1 Tax=Sphaeroforma arctica JP610 TaxID=667725 RepID=A0A0L0FV82_9EUKA|nr:hypothetical protein SARC_07091 [Sphaeroforma arctica JP610]KNC80544.1 hypothetical protein SARC_07091 [Sphaeroforma arctica JP610]|eukprot:XP_014154446.1 hypothetical protein SARC_07091 [Sphaeroforma arctica JP610]
MGLIETIVTSTKERVASATQTELVLAIVLITFTIVLVTRRSNVPEGVKFPPRVGHYIPFVGSAIEFGASPITFLHECYKTYGPVFTFKMMGMDCTYVIGSEASALMFNSKNDDLNAESVYASLTVPVFGKGVAYDIDAKEFGEQKRISKAGLTINRFQEYVPMIEEETTKYLQRWGNEGKTDLFKCMAELVIMTASRCLLGREVRALLDESVADLYHDLDGGFTPAAWLLPGWLPLPSFRTRDRAHIKLKKVFTDIIGERRRTQKEKAEGESEGTDMMWTFMNTPYRNGQLMTDDQVAGMCIALLLAGQHTSSTTASWAGFYMCHDKRLQDRARAEVLDTVGEHTTPTFEDLKELTFLDNTIRETLRLRPPIMTMMRTVQTPQQLMGYTIPIGGYVCASPTVNHLLEDAWGPDNMDFNPDRFEGMRTDKADELTRDASATPGKGKFSYVPFGAGRHRCIGEMFAYTQIKTIWTTMLREFELSRDSLPDIDYTTMIHTPKDPWVYYKRREAHKQAPGAV